MAIIINCGVICIILALATYRNELCHVTFIRGPQLSTDKALSLFAVVYSSQDSDGPLHVEGS